MRKILIFISFFLSITCCYSQTAEEYLNSGVEKFNLQDYRGAIEDLNKAIEINPLFVDAYGKRGAAKTILKDYRGALSDYTKAIEINPQDALAYYTRGLLKLKLDQKDSACLDLSKADELGYYKASLVSS